MRRVLAAALICLLLAGCGKTDKDLTLDMEALCNELLEGGVFEETLYPAEESAVPLLLDFETECEGLVYVGTGATAEELVLFHGGDEDEAGQLKENLSQHLADRTEQYSGYLPQEAYKLENAILQQYGTYVILCIAADTAAAEEIIGSYTE